MKTIKEFMDWCNANPNVKIYQLPTQQYEVVDSWRLAVAENTASEVELAAFLKEIENLAAQSQLSLQEVRPISTEGGEWYQEYGLEVHCLASLAEWTKFVYLIESSTSMLTIERAAMGLEKEGSKTLKGSMRIKRLVLLDQPAKPIMEG